MKNVSENLKKQESWIVIYINLDLTVKNSDKNYKMYINLKADKSNTYFPKNTVFFKPTFIVKNASQVIKTDKLIS